MMPIAGRHCEPLLRTLHAWLLLGGLCALSPALADEPPAGFVTLDGAPASFDAFRGQGRWLVVKIWASDCHVCNETAHEMVALSVNHRRDMQVLGIAVDGHDNRPGVLSFIERHALNYPTLLDDGHGAARVYRRDVMQDWRGWTPTYLVYTPQGELVAQNIGAVAESDVVRFVDSYRAKSAAGSGP